jgi:hypothetical protein
MADEKIEGKHHHQESIGPEEGKKGELSGKYLEEATGGLRGRNND